VSPSSGISVIIPTLNRARDLKKALDSLARQTLKPREVIVVDQSPDDSTRELCRTCKAAWDKGTRIQLVYLWREERGCAGARNRGIEAASGELLCFLDDDIELFDDYLEQVVKYLSTRPSVGAVGGNVLSDRLFTGWKGRIRKFIMRFFLLNSFDGRMTASGFGYPINDRPIERPEFVDMLIGCNMVIRRKFLEKERFDEWFTGYSYREDVDLTYRVSRQTQIVMIPEAKLYHHCSPEARISSVEKKRMQIKNYFYMFKKYKYRGFWSRFLFGYSILGLLVIDFLELATHHDRESLQVFTASLRAVFGAPDGKK
jgi:GT2 family glycosyltransferase